MTYIPDWTEQPGPHDTRRKRKDEEILDEIDDSNEGRDS